METTDIYSPSLGKWCDNIKMAYKKTQKGEKAD